MYKWLLIPPDREQIENTHFQNDKLEEIMVKYRQSQSAAAAMFEKRKRDMIAKPVEGDLPYIDPSDENSKFYTKPDVPPIPHPSDLLDDLKKEFPDASIEELVAKADLRVAAEVMRRREAAAKEAALTTVVEENPEASPDDDVPAPLGE